MATRPKGYLPKGKTKSFDAVRKAKAREDLTPKGLGKMVLGAALSGAPIGRGAKAAGVAKNVIKAVTKKDPVITSAMKATAKYKKNMDKLERAENKAISLSSARTRANIDKMEKSGNYKKVGKPKRKPAEAPKSAKPALSRVLRENRMRDLKIKKYQGSLSKEPKPLSKTPRLSIETKQLLEKFQTPKVRPPATRTSLGGMIGEARPLAKAQRRQAAAEELKKRPVTKRKVNPKDIKEARIAKAKAAKEAKVKIEPTGKPSKLTRPARPPRAKTNQNLTKNNRSGKYDNRGEELDLSTDKDIQTVRGKEYPDGFPMRPRFEGKTIESRSSQAPGSRGRNVNKVDEARKRKEDVREKQENDKLDEQLKLAAGTYFPKSNPNKRIPRKTLEDRLVQLKKQARSKRATAAADKAKYDKLTPAQRVRVKKILKEK
jgi:hypothetical protein